MKNIVFILASFFFGSSAFGQTTWYEIQTGTTSNLNAIDFPSHNVGYIVGSDTTILKSIDGGQTWTQLALNGIGIAALADDFKDVQFVDENVGFIVTGYSGVYKTTDGAQSWTQVPYSMCFPETVFPFNDADYLIGGGDCFTGAKIDKVVNSVANPATIITDFWFDYEIVMEMSFSGLNRGLAAVRNEYMLRTVDGGSIWDTIPVNVPGAITSVVMVNDTLCYGGYEDPNTQGFGVLTSVDGGLTWTQDVNSATFYYPSYLCVEAASNGDVYSGASSPYIPNGLIFELVAGQSGWSYEEVGQPIHDMTSYGSDITFGVGDSGYLVVNTPVSELSVINVESKEFEVYPNPIQEELVISNSAGNRLEAMLIDAAGREVKTINLEAGQNLINCEGLKSGMYLLKVIQGDSQFIERIIKQ